MTTSDIFVEIRLSRALAVSVDKLLRENTPENMEDVRQNYNALNALYRQHMDRELS